MRGNMSDLSKLIGERIRKNRKAQHLSQKELAERSGFHPAYIGQLERGEKNATLDSVQGICAGLGIPMEQLFVGIAPENADESTRMQSQINALLASMDMPERRAVYNMIVEVMKLKS